MDADAVAEGAVEGDGIAALVVGRDGLRSDRFARAEQLHAVVADERLRNAARLYQMLLKQLPNVQTAIRHYDISMKLCPLTLIDETKWEAFKKLLEEVDEVVTKSKMIINGKEIEVERILKDGTNYVKVRDLAAALGLDVSNQGNIAVLTRK